MMSFDYDTDYDPPAPVVLAEIAHPSQGELKVGCTALVDTGADGTMLPIDLLEQINAPLVGDALMRGVLGAGERVDIFLAQIKIGNYPVGGIRVAAMSVGSEPILGRDVLNQFIITLNGLANIAKFSP